MAKAREIPELHGAMSFREVARAAVRVRADEVFVHAGSVLDTEDIDRVHDMRVATRRLRAVLEVFADAFDARAHRAALRDVTTLADALGARRDPDVQLASLEAFADAMTPADQPGIELFAQRLRAEQAGGNRTLADALEAMRADDLEGRLRALAEDGAVA
jgi:CHAD domain-containing protein